MEDVTGQSLVIGDILWFSNYNVSVYSGNLQMIQPIKEDSGKIVKTDILKLSPNDYFKKVYRIKKRRCGTVCKRFCRYGHSRDEEGCPQCGCNPKPSTSAATN